MANTGRLSIARKRLNACKHRGLTIAAIVQTHAPVSLAGLTTFGSALFDDVARDGLDQWVYFLKNGAIKRDFTGRGLKEAQAALDIMRLSEAERRAYASHIDGQRIDIGVAQSTIVRAESAERALEEAENRVQEERRQKDEERRLKDAALLEIEELRRQLAIHRVKKS